MAITMTTGIFSGLDTGQIVDKLMALERKPLQQLLQKKASYEAKISSYGSILSTLSTLKNSLSSLKSGSILSMSASSSDNTVFTASASSSASEGSYNIKVNNLAASQGIYSAAFAAETSQVADLSTYATQKIKITVGGGSPVEITIDSSNNTLSGIRDAINNANAGVKASIVNDGTGYRLIISSNTTGASNSILVQVDEDNNGAYEEAPSETDPTGLSKLAFNATYDADGNVTGGITNMTQSQAALDAKLVIDGLTVTRGSNTISDLITGVTISLLDDSAGSTIALKVSKDLSTIEKNINSFVSAYNQVMQLAKNLSTPSKGQSVILTGDSTTRGIISSLRSAITTSFADKTPSSLGLNHSKDGLLSLSTSILDEAMKDDLQSVIDTFDAMAGSLEDTIGNYVGTLIPARKDGLNSSVNMTEDRIEGLGRRLEKIELSYRKRFTLLEQTLGRLQQNGAFLEQQLAALSTMNNRGNNR